ncbi:MAG: hypothetical protein R3F11_17585 [Verrucomicrobiales bacterium]
MPAARAYRGSQRHDIAAGADPNVPDASGRTALHLAMDSPEGGTEVVDALIKAGADLNAIDHEGNTPILITPSEMKSDDDKILFSKRL